MSEEENVGVEEQALQGKPPAASICMVNVSPPRVIPATITVVILVAPSISYAILYCNLLGREHHWKRERL